MTAPILPTQSPEPATAPAVYSPSQPSSGGLLATVNNQPALLAFAVTAIGLVGAVVLLAIGKAVPDALWGVTAGSGLVGGGKL